VVPTNGIDWCLTNDFHGVKAGFMWAGKAGSGLVVARLPDGTWSAPSAIGTAGMSFGGQIGAEVLASSLRTLHKFSSYP
jgi:lipid-binding SYLF domain-containing protein